MMDVFMVEDTQSARGYLRSMLSNIPGVSLVGFAEDELGAIDHISRLLPDVVTLETGLKRGSGIAVLEYIKKHHAAIRVIVLTSYADEYYRNSDRQAEADYVFDKNYQSQQVVSVFWALTHGARADNNVETRQTVSSIT